jgi:hypothetical protein
MGMRDERKGTKMQGLGSFSAFLNESKKDCNSVLTIQDINTQYSYEDKIGGGGSREWDLLSCGQNDSTNGYNEHDAFKKCVGEKLGIVL